MTDEVSRADGSPVKSAEDLFNDFIWRVQQGEHAHIDGLCRSHPEHEAELRRRHRTWQRAGQALGRLGINQPESDQTPKTEAPISAWTRLPAPAPEVYTSRYSIGLEIGRGGMGSILSVRDEHLNRELAMKVLRGQEALFAGGAEPATPPHDLARFLEEARITGGLQHPNIVPVHELGADPDGKPYFTMKLVEGRTFREVLPLARSGRDGWNVERALGVLLKVCQAVGYAHDKDVIHRDLKPANLMVGSFGEVYVMDWGLARDFSRPEVQRPEDAAPEAPHNETSSSFRTRDGEVLGTPEYMAPEQAAGNRDEVGPLADVYSIGAMLYELLTGVGPNPVRERGAAFARVAAVFGAPPKEVRLIAPQTPAELCAICERAIARDPRDRYPGMIELADDLQAYLEGRVVKAHATGAWAEFRKWIQRNPVSASLAGTVIALVGIGLVVISGLALRISEQKNNLETQRTEMLHLSLSQDYEDLVAESEDFWPVHPDKVDDMRAWVTNATMLTEALPKLLAKRDQLRALALPQTDDERRAERESHPAFGKLAPLQAQIAAEQGALALRRGEAQLELPAVDWEGQPSEANTLNARAWTMVDPDREAFGQEALGLALALRSAELASEASNRDEILDTVAWARFALGDDEGALDASYAALESSPDDRREQAASNFGKLEEAVAAASGTEGFTAAETAIAKLEQRLVELEDRVSKRRTWTFTAEQERETKARWWHNQLTGLIGRVDSLLTTDRGLLVEDGVSAAHGWSVPRRLRAVETLRDRFAPGGAFALRWERDLPAIREAYPGLELTVQLGLVPIGPDPESSLWEFWSVLSGEEPLRDKDGLLQLEERSGLVFVLLPGGKFWMGSQSKDPEGRNYDKYANKRDGPVHEVELSAFFLSKYEMTQGQWRWLVGWNPSDYGPDTSELQYLHDMTHPVESISWWDCTAILPYLDLQLPSEAQWEYGARAGTDTVWWTGSDKESLRKRNALNLADEAAATAKAIWGEIAVNLNDMPGFNDGYAVHAPVDEYAANGFGLHNVHGNVWEWCLDGFDLLFYEREHGTDPVSPRAGLSNGVNRGGAFNSIFDTTRSAFRRDVHWTRKLNNLGVRPARAITE